MFVLGLGAQGIAWRFRLPSILLLVFGFVAGPVTGFLAPERLQGGWGFAFVSLSVGIILFEGAPRSGRARSARADAGLQRRRSRRRAGAAALTPARRHPAYGAAEYFRRRALRRPPPMPAACRLRPLLAVLLAAGALGWTGCSNRALLDEQQAEIDLLRSDLADAYNQIDSLRAQNADLEYRLRQAMQREVESARNGERGETVAVLPADIFFESGSAALRPEGVDRLAEVAQRLRAEFPDREIRVEGYTDDKPIGPNLEAQYPSNWELSAARAATVARHLQWTHGFEGQRMEVVGLSQYHPQASNATAEGRQQNRRVRIAVMGG